MNTRSMNSARSFSNGNGSGNFNGSDACLADWYAGHADDRLLWHWAAM